MDNLYCRCGCGLSKDDMNQPFLIQLYEAQSYSGNKFNFTSGIRCKDHNKKVGGSDTSSHLLGLAVDIECKTSRDRALIIKALIKAGLDRIGIGKTFIHVDNDINKAQDVFWLY